MRKIIAVCFAVMFVFAGNMSAENISVPGSPLAIDGDYVVGSYIDSFGVQSYIYNRLTKDWVAVAKDGTNGIYATDISGNNVVGYFYDLDWGCYGFRYDRATKDWETLPAPVGAAYTYVCSISGNDIAGNYEDDVLGDSHGFIYNLTSGYGSLTPFTGDLIGATNLALNNIDGNRLVGQCQNSSGEYHGCFFDGTIWNTLDIGTTTTNLWCINGDHIVGTYTSGAVSAGFDYDITTETWISLSVPGATHTEVSGLYNGDYIGWYFDSSGNSHNFIGEIPVPEPSTLALLTIALIAGTFFFLRKR